MLAQSSVSTSFMNFSLSKWMWLALWSPLCSVCELDSITSDASYWSS